MGPGRTVRACVALVITVVLDQWRLLYPGQFTLLSGAESVRQAYSWFTFWQRSLLHAAWPLWDPNAWGGYAFAGEMQTAPFYPLYLILILFRPNHYGLLSVPLYNALFVIAHVLAALFMFALLRQLRISRFASFAGGFAFSSGSFVGAVGWPHMLQSAIWLPCILLFLLRALESEAIRGLIRNALFSGFCLGLSLLAGGLHIAMSQTLVVFAAAAYYAIASEERRSTGQNRWARCLGAAILCLLAAIGLAAVQLLPSSVYAQHSIRAMGGVGFLSNVKVPYTFLTHDGLAPNAVASFLFPSFDGIGFGEVWTPYAGVLTFLFATLAVNRLWSRFWIRFLTGLGAAAFLYSLAGTSALHGVLYVIAPFLWMAREATRFIYLTGFCLSVLAAYGLEYFCTALHDVQLWSKCERWLGVAIGLCIALFTAGVFAPKLGGFWEYFSVLLILLSCTLLCYAVSVPGFREGWTFRFLVIGILFFDLNAFNWTAANKLENGHNGTDEVDVLNSLRGVSEFLHRQPGPFRVKVLQVPEPNIGDAFGLQTLAGGGVTIDKHVWKVQPLVDLLNVTYLIRPATAVEPGAIYQDKDWKVYRNIAAFPRAWIVHRFEVKPDEAAMQEETRRRGSELRSIALLERRPPGTVTGSTALASDSVRFDTYSASKIRLHITTSEPGLLVLGEMYYPEWRASVNGRDEEILRTDEALRSVAIPAGQSSIELNYRPASVYIGLAVSLLTACIILVAALWGQLIFATPPQIREA